MADIEMKKEVCILIDEKLEALSSTTSENTISRVPLCLYKANKELYEPQFISIGPYHHGKPHLKMMEAHKVRFLRKLLDRMNKPNAETFVASIQGMIGKVQNCYAESLSLSNKELLEMLVLDGCFMVELIYQYVELNEDEYITRNKVLLLGIVRDLILLDNQLPFFILLELFKMTKEGLYTTEKYIQQLLGFYCMKLPGLRVWDASVENAHHLLDLVHKNWLPSRETMEYYSQAPNDGKWLFIRSATELKEAGIRFKKGEEGGSVFDIKFRNGVLEIPPILIDDNAESLFRNIILCEQFGNKKPTYFTDFHIVMDSLINTGKDVELLCRCGIIDNWSGDDEVVAGMFNRLGDNCAYSKEDFFYAQLFNDINQYFNTPWNRRMASLRHNYFNTPWALVSFVAAAFLLLLTFLQTAFTIFPAS